MGVDVDTYRCRFGSFVTNRGGGMMLMPFAIDFIDIMNLIGAISFVRILLIIAGIEQNPSDKFIFRYQYHLIEIDPKVLRQLFDYMVGNDFMQYLNANPTQYNRLYNY